MVARSDRDVLIEQHREYARALAFEIARTLPPFVSRVDLVSVAIQGLVEAATRFDPTRGVQFKSFAYYRIRGAVYDEVRRLCAGDPYARSRVACAAAVDAMVEGALAERPRSASDGPADAAEALAGVLDAAATAFTVAQCAEALVSEGSRNDPEDSASLHEESALLRDAMATLPEKERVIVQQVYFEGRTIEEAGASMGLSKSWASRLHARALSLLRDEMGALG
jgi:RNA polymerase sigma factor for flagellar operon FliA